MSGFFDVFYSNFEKKPWQAFRHELGRQIRVRFQLA